MDLENRLKNRSVLMRAGMAFLLAGNLSRWFLHPSSSSGQNAVDGAFGFLIGAAIACLLLSLRRAPRRCEATPQRPG